MRRQFAIVSGVAIWRKYLFDKLETQILTSTGIFHSFSELPPTGPTCNDYRLCNDTVIMME